MADEERLIQDRVQEEVPAGVQEDRTSWKHRALEFGLLLITTGLYLVTVIVNGFAAFASDPHTFGFLQDIGNVSAMYPTDITPANWVFAIWAVIYLWQAAWLLWAWVFLAFCSRATRTISLLLYVFFGIACACNIVWVYLWGNVIVIGALTVIILFALSLILSVAFSVRKTASVALGGNQGGGWKNTLSRWITYVLVHNGLAVYTTWLCIAWLLNMSIVADAQNGFRGAMSRDDAGTLALSLLTVEVILWFLLEQTCLEHYVRYIHTIYPVLIVAMVGVLVEHWNRGTEESMNHIFVLGILVLVVILQIARFAFTVIFYLMRRQRRRRRARVAG